MKKSIAKIHNFNFEYFNNDDMASKTIGVNNEWEPHITNFIKLYNLLYNIKNIIDVGANFGYHTLLFSQQVSDNVFAFEPQSQNFNLLENNVKNNNIKNVILYNFACGDTNSDIKMSIIEDNVLSVNMGDFTPNILANDNFTITKSILLDDMNFPDISIIKIDVQGWEKKVLLGATNLINKYKPILIIEFEIFQLQKTNTSCKDLFDYIRNNNYYIFYLDYFYPSDHVCVHNDNLEDFRIQFKKYIFPHTIDNNINNNIHYGVCEKILIQPFSLS